MKQILILEDVPETQRWIDIEQRLENQVFTAATLRAALDRAGQPTSPVDLGPSGSGSICFVASER